MKTIKTVLDEVQQEYYQRYEWGDEEYECRSLFVKIRSEIEAKITTAFDIHGALSLEEILLIVFKFGEAWKNEPTQCDDTDGRIHINSIYSKLEANLKELKEPEAKKESSFYSKQFITFYLIFLTVLFVLFLRLVDSL